ncbi:MAG: exosortase/archaeosortase family protein, partial [Phycisphaeraceae bacterium]
MNQPENPNPSVAAGAAPQAPPETNHVLGLPIAPHVWQRLAILAVLFIIVHSDFLIRTARIAWTDGDWSHAMLVPFFSLYFVYQQREKLADVTARPCWPALAVVVGGLVGYLTGLIYANDMLKGYSMIVEMFGLVLLLAGPGVARLLWFPILYLAFAVKISPNLWETIAWQMQLFAAHASVLTLTLIGLDVQVTTTTIELWRGVERLGALNVA